MLYIILIERMKKIITLLALMLLSVMGVMAEQYNHLVDGIYYDLIGAYNDDDQWVYDAFVAPQYTFSSKGGTGSSSNNYSGNLVIPESVEIDGVTYKVKGICTGAFSGCSLGTVVLPETLEMIYEDLGSCSIENLHISSWKWWCGLSSARSKDDHENFYYRVNLLNVAKHVVVDGEECDMTDFILPGGITSIRPYAFWKCSGMKNLTLSDDVRIIGDHAFEGCGLKEVVIPDNVEVVGEGCFAKNNLEKVIVGRNLREMGTNSFYNDSEAFEASNTYLKVIVPNLAGWCENLSTKCFNTQHLHLFTDADTEIIDLVVPEGVKSIHDGSFYILKSLKSVSIPSSVESIGEEAFSLCTNMEEVNIAEGVKVIGGWSFARVNTLKSVSIPNSVETIGDYAFFACDQLQEVTMGDGVKTIGEKAFSTWGSSVLHQVVFGKALETIGNGAFDSCEALQVLVARNEEPWPFDESKNIFPASIYRKATLFIPDGSKDIYFRMDGWRKFLKIYEHSDALGVRGVDVGQSQQTSSQYNLSGCRQTMTEAAVGARIFIRNGKKYVVK